MIKLILALLLALLLAPLTTAQDFDYCDPPQVALPAIPPCPNEEHRDLQAVLACVATFYEAIADDRVATCSAGQAAVATWNRQRLAAMVWYTDELSKIHSEYFACVADGGDIQMCDAIWQVAKANALQTYNQMLTDAQDELDVTMAVIELQWHQRVAAHQAAFNNCISLIPCE